MDIKFDTIKKLNAADTVKENMGVYQQYLVQSKLPHPIDGLKDVTRRAIYVMSTKKDTIKFTQFIASIMEMHPHGDSSIKGAVERLFRTHDVTIPLITATGNSGSYTKECAAARYLNVTSSEFARDLFFNNIHSSTIPMRYTVEYDMFEPKYFIPRLPTALLIGNLTIGAGFKSLTLPSSLPNVCDLVHRFIDHKRVSFKQFSGKGVGHLLVPDFSSHCELRNYDELLEAYNNEAYTHKVFTSGILDIDKHKIRILNTPALTPYPPMVEKLIEQLKDKNFWLNNFSKDIQMKTDSKFTGGFTVIFKNNVDPWKILDRFKKLIGYTGSLTPIMNYGVDGMLVNCTPLRIMEMWYEARYQSITNGLNAVQNQLLRERLFINALMCIVDNKDKVVETIKAADSREQAVESLVSIFDITRNQATTICKASLERLVKTSKDDLVLEHEKITKELEHIQSKYSSIDSTIYDDASYFRSKYKNTRRTNISNYIGYIKIGGYGICQYSSEEELFELLSRYDNVNGIYQYASSISKKALIFDNKIETPHGYRLAKHEQGSSILEKVFNDQDAYTLVYVGDGVSYIEGYVVPKDDTRVQYVSKKIVGLHDNGTISASNITEFSQRKTVSSGAKNSLIYAFSDKNAGKNKIIVYMSTAPGYVNEVFFTKAYNNTTGEYNRLMITPPHELVVLDIIDENMTGAIINLDKRCINLSAEYLYISDISKIINTFSTKTMNIRTGSYVSTDGDKVKPSRHTDCSTMVVI